MIGVCVGQVGCKVHTLLVSVCIEPCPWSLIRYPQAAFEVDPASDSVALRCYKMFDTLSPKQAQDMLRDSITNSIKVRGLVREGRLGGSQRGTGQGTEKGFWGGGEGVTGEAGVQQ